DIEFANYQIGHANSTYWRLTPEERLETFNKFRDYLTYLDYSKLEAKGADIVTKLDQKDQEMEAMKQQFLEYQNTTTEHMNAMLEQIDELMQVTQRNVVKKELLRT